MLFLSLSGANGHAVRPETKRRTNKLPRQSAFPQPSVHDSPTPRTHLPVAVERRVR